MRVSFMPFGTGSFLRPFLNRLSSLCRPSALVSGQSLALFLPDFVGRPRGRKLFSRPGLLAVRLTQASSL
jgi:hypothetical protein